MSGFPVAGIIGVPFGTGNHPGEIDGSSLNRLDGLHR